MTATAASYATHADAAVAAATDAATEPEER